jgi:pimeloyl-ACP methyl ester carboxylesterase
MLVTDNGQVAIYRWGSSNNKVLILPGWNSRASHFRSFIKQLSAMDYQVIGIDPPGHGHSDGSWNNIRWYLATINQVHQRHGPFEAVIGHSFGGFCIPFALDRFQLARKAVLLSTPLSLEWLFNRYCDIIHASPDIRQRMDIQIKQLLGENCWHDYDISVKAKQLAGIPALVIHDDEDHGVPLDHARAIHTAWPGAQLEITHKLGHQRVLRHRDSVNPVIAFIRQD